MSEGTLPVRLRFSLFWAIVQTAVGVLWLASPAILLAVNKGGGDPVKPAFYVFALGATPSAPWLSLGARGLSRRDQLVIGHDGLSGPLVAKGGGTLAWGEIEVMSYAGRGSLMFWKFWGTLTLRARGGRRVSISDLCL